MTAICGTGEMRGGGRWEGGDGRLMSANALEVISSGAEVTQEELASITAGHAYVVVGPAALHGLRGINGRRISYTRSVTASIPAGCDGLYVIFGSGAVKHFTIQHMGRHKRLLDIERCDRALLPLKKRTASVTNVRSRYRHA
jgi:hypothetical protein